MTPTTPPPAGDDLHLLLGAFVLGGLSEDEHRAFTQHLRTCPTCQTELAQVSGLPSLLALVDPVDLDGLAPTSPTAAAAVAVPGAPSYGEPVAPVALLAEVRRRRVRRRLLTTAAAAVLVVASALTGLSLYPVVQQWRAGSDRIVATGPPGSRTVVSISLEPRTWGTQMVLDGSDLPTDGVFYLEVTDRQGRSWEVASWTGTPSGRTTLQAACWVQRATISKVVIQTRDGSRLAEATVAAT